MSADDVSMTGHLERSDAAVLEVEGLYRLVEVLIERGYRVVGPTLRDNAIVLSELESATDLPRGWGVDVSPGHYRVRRRDDDAAFGHSAGPQSWTQFLHPPRQRLWAGNRDGTDDTQTRKSRGTHSSGYAVVTWPRSAFSTGCSVVPSIRTARLPAVSGRRSSWR
jgi:hypothetical protein